MGFLDSSSRIECTEMRSGGTSCLELKSEPMGPSSPESSSEILTGPDDCAGCGRLIQVTNNNFAILRKLVDQNVGGGNLKSSANVYSKKLKNSEFNLRLVLL